MSRTAYAAELWTTVVVTTPNQLDPTDLATLAEGDHHVLVIGAAAEGSLVGGAIHALSRRRDHSLVSLDARDLPEQLAYSELFGHLKDGFAGACRAKPGRVQRAHRGTLLVEHIGVLTPRLQTALNRFAETGEVWPLGASSPSDRVDVRIIATTP